LSGGIACLKICFAASNSGNRAVQTGSEATNLRLHLLFCRDAISNSATGEYALGGIRRDASGNIRAQEALHGL
jgi:hypothetical protein